MTMGRASAIRRDLGRLFEGQSVAGLGEVQLLERFVERRDEPAFAALVSRHGPMVLGVCRRLLADPHDVEDAFQATFLVLVRRASSLRSSDRLGPWLFGVARKVAARMRSDRTRRRGFESSRAVAIAQPSGVDDLRGELGRALIEEIDRLPASLRHPIVLCCVEGLTYDEAATQLGSTGPTIRGRLSRDRERLRARLTRRGFAPTLGGLGGLLTTGAARAVVPSRLLLLTISQASKAGVVPAAIEALVEGVIRTMIVTKSKFLAAALVACGVASSSLVGFSQTPGTTPATASFEPAPVVPGGGDRLSQVEQKLDRVLRALERQPDNTSLVPPAPPAPTTAPPPPLPPRPGAVVKHLTPGGMTQPGGAGKMTKTVEVQVEVPDPTKPGSRSTTTTTTITPQPLTETRIKSVEQKLERLEARIAAIEKKLGSDAARDLDDQEDLQVIEGESVRRNPARPGQYYVPRRVFEREDGAKVSPATRQPSGSPATPDAPPVPPR